ncbi:MAG: hypothetical protein IJZ56_03670 [Oscillospiraceae bacterium]|nr:hypothetical protein [Oscillospiraceae bacterium]
MKKTFLVVLSFLLAAIVALSLAACGKNEAELPEKKDPVSQYKARGFDASTLKNQVSWEGINAFKPTTEIAELYETDPDAAIAEARQIAIDFFIYAKTATWIPSDTWEFTHHADGDNPDVMTGGQVYGGLPYVGLGSSAIYRLMDFIDAETGVVDIYTAAGKNHEYQKMFGNQCANGAYQGWCRFINSAKYSGTPRMTQFNNFIPVGDYTYPQHTIVWTTDYNTKDVCAENGDQTMFEAYAKLVPGDGVVNYTTAGHVMMVVSEPTVVHDTAGKIDSVRSYVYIADQHVEFSTYQHPNGGDVCQAANYINNKYTFQKLVESGYLPFTYKEWLGEDPIEVPDTAFSHTGDAITLNQLYNAKITSNYHIYDIYAEIYDAAGNEVVKIGTHNDGASQYTLQFAKVGIQAVCWGDPNELDLSKEHTVKVYCQLGTGERPVLWMGKLVQE